MSGFPDITLREVHITQSIEDRDIQDQTYQLLYSLKEIFNIGDQCTNVPPMFINKNLEELDDYITIR